ncbi:MAG: hypothetical protein IK028_01375 [Bacilli bacterium]|nr:hypothetical protein [Bacilli bacterium]
MNKRRIILSSLVGMAAIAALSVSLTWAWYASSDRLKINSFEIDLSGNVQLLMSTSKELDSFKEGLTREELVENEFLFAPVSSMHRDTWFNQKADTPIFYDSSTPSLTEIPSVEEASSGFFQKRIYLLSTFVDYYAALDVEQCTFAYNEELNSLRAQDLHKEYPELSVDEITQKLNSLRDCLRMSILVNEEDYYRYYVIDPYKQENEDILFGGVLDNDGDGYYDYYTDEHGNKKEVVYGEVNDLSKVAYDDPVNPNGEVESLESKGHYFGNSFTAKNRIDTYTFNKANSNGLEIAKEESYALKDLDEYDTEVVIPCYHGKPTEIVISIYLEGWDQACINNTMGACFDTNISFKLLRRIL